MALGLVSERRQLYKKRRKKLAPSCMVTILSWLFQPRPHPTKHCRTPPASGCSDRALPWVYRNQKPTKAPLRPFSHPCVCNEFQQNGEKSPRDPWQEDPEEEDEHLPEDESEDEESEEGLPSGQGQGSSSLSAENLGESLRQEGKDLSWERCQRWRGSKGRRSRTSFPSAQASLLPSCGSRAP